MRIDVHQHVWTAPLQDALSRRGVLPLICSQEDVRTVHCHGELPYVLDGAGENAEHRTELLDRDRLDAAIVEPIITDSNRGPQRNAGLMFAAAFSDRGVRTPQPTPLAA